MADSIPPGVLHFYPGQKILVFLVKGHLRTWAVAWGGPPTEQPVIPGQPFAAGPTDPGRFVIWKIAPYTTHTWTASRIRWGVKLKPDPKHASDVLYQTDSGAWASVLKKTEMSRADIEVLNKELYGTATVPATWVFNDFGRVAIRYFRDRNHNGVLDENEHLSGEMFHATPQNEADTVNHPDRIYMGESHGCIHLRPQQRDRLIKARIFARGRVLIVHKYDEKFVRAPGDPSSAESMI